MADSITITHRITAKGVTTSVRMPGKKPIYKTWIKMADGSFMMGHCTSWEDEVDLPESIRSAAERGPVDVCGLISNS